jgi:hypothetical protein
LKLQTIKRRVSTLYVSYINLSVGLGNPFNDFTHQIVLRNLRERFAEWKGFFDKYEDYSLGFIIATEKGTAKLTVKGSSVSRRMKAVDFSIFLPDQIAELKPTTTENVFRYLDAVFKGISSALDNYGVDDSEIESIRDKCKREIQI